MQSDTRAYRNAVFLMLAILFLGPLGFMLLEGMNYLDSLYMTVITVSTVGFKEVAPMDDLGRVYVIVLIFLGVIGVTYIARHIGTNIIEGQIRSALGKRKMDTRLKKLRNHTIIAGYGRVGQEVVRQFNESRKGSEFVVVENDLDAIEQLAGEEILFVRGDVTVDETLREAGLEHATTLISTVPGDADNVYLTITARHLRPNITIIARADHHEAERKLMRAGANQVVSPHQLGGVRMAHLAIRPSLVHFFHSLAAEEEGFGVEEIIVSENSPLDGQSLRELDLRRKEDLTVIGIRKAEKGFVLNPGVDTKIEAGDLMLLIGDPDKLLSFSERC